MDSAQIFNDGCSTPQSSQIRQLVHGAGAMVRRAWRFVSGDAATRPLVDAPLDVADSNTGDEVTARYPLSPLQHTMLVHSLQAQHVGVDIEQIVIELHEELNVAALRHAWQLAAQRHAILRTVFRWDGPNGPDQGVRRCIAIPWSQADWRGLSQQERDARFEQSLLADRARCFRLHAEPAVRLMLVQDDEQRFRFVWTFHHIAMDGRGIVALLAEVFDIYEALSSGRTPVLEPPIAYSEFIAWQQRRDWSPSERFWRDLLKGFQTPTPVVVARKMPRDLEPAQMRGEQCAWLSCETTALLTRLTTEHHLTLNTLVQGAWALLLSRYSGEEDVVFGTIRACRHNTVPHAEQVVGMCINTTPMRVRVPSAMMVLPWLAELRQQWVAIREHEHTPLTMIQGWSEAPRGAALFETLVNFQDPSWDAALHNRSETWSKRGLSIVSQPSLPLVLDAYGGELIKLILLYDRRLFDDDVITRMLGHLRSLMESIAANANQSLGILPLMPKEERRQMLAAGRQTKTAYPNHASVHRLFEAQVKARPNAIALTFIDEAMTYAELNRRANQLARHLQANGVTHGTLVGICVERSLDMIVGLLGILKAGGAYVPLDPGYPQERLAFMLADTKAPILLTQDRLRGNLPRTNAIIICLDSDWPTITHSPANLEFDGSGDELAYVIYTSGSTGKPKGACIPHRGIVRLTKNTNYVRLDHKQVFVQFAPISFDASTFEIWACLLNGARLVIFPPFKPSLDQLGQVIRDECVTTLWLTAALFQHMVEHCCEMLCGVRQLLAGGDVLPIAAVRKVLRDLPGIRLINGYGPTENTTFTCCHTITSLTPDATSVPIGRPIANTTVYVLDPRMQPVPIGVPGELWTGGDGLAQCYLNQPELTAQRFVVHAGERLYRIGDLVRWLPDGTLEFLGRIDQQVKIRGFRIELGEIESVLAQHPTVREAVVIKREDTPGDARLVAYVVLKPEANGVIDRPRQFLKEKLPDYMVPSTVVVMNELPLSPAGKVDRRALPKPERGEKDGAEFVKPRTLTEEVVAGIWEDVLKVDRIGAHDNFFETGGDSLMATLAVVRVGKALEASIPVSLLFDRPTLADLCDGIDQLRAKQRGVERTLIARAQRDQPLPLSLFQERIWEHCRSAADSRLFMTQINIDLKGPIDVAFLQRALSEVVRRHEVLRTTIGTDDGLRVQVVRSVQSVPLPIVESDDNDSGMLDDAFDLAEGPLLRARIERLGADHHRFVLVVHHLIYDGSLREIFFRELGVLYAAFARGESSPLPEPTLQYADFAVWQRRQLSAESTILQEQLAYWHKQLDKAEPVRLPFERSKPPTPNLADAMQVFPWFPKGLCKRLSVVSSREGATLFMTLLAAFKAMLHGQTGQNDILIGTYVASHHQPELESVIGLKTNLIALRTNLSGNPTFRELLRRVRATTLDAYAHQDVLFHQLLPIPDVQAIFQHVRIEQIPLSLPGVTVEFLEPTAKTMPWGFSLNFMQCGDDHVVGGLTFDTDRYDPDAVRGMAPAYIEILERIANDPDLRLSQVGSVAASKAA